MKITGCGGCFYPTDDLNDAEVVYLAKSAVSEHNKKAKTHLHFMSVINGQSSSFRFMLVISAKDDNNNVGPPKYYLANVLFRQWEKKNLFILASFEQIQD